MFRDEMITTTAADGSKAECLITGVKGPDGKRVGPGKKVYTSGERQGQTRFSLPIGVARPFLDIFGNGGRRYGFLNASGKPHGTAVYIFSHGEMFLQSFLDSAKQSSLKGRDEDCWSFIKETWAGAMMDEGFFVATNYLDIDLDYGRIVTMSNITGDALPHFQEMAREQQYQARARRITSAVTKATLPPPPKPSSTNVPATPPTAPPVATQDKAPATSFGTTLPPANAILNDWDCSELGGVLLSMKIAPNLVKILVENSVSGMMVAEGIVTDEDLHDSGITSSLQRKALLTAFKKLRDMRATGSTLAVLLDPEAC